MGKNITRIVYKPDTQSTEEYIIIVHPEELKKYKAGDTTIPLTDVVESFQVFFSNQGNQGLLGKPSKQQLETVFGTSVDVEIIKLMIQKGKDQSSDHLGNNFGSTNVTRGSITEHRSGATR
ncbi:ribosome maturation protein [Thelephora terrestris]|uniref:Ribosome maturation protein n=1 Tax=Thelephora terrestris TaxID=56493 RepID=A0A9P6L2E3_9AGAM|nr:ribosome maturation protein [Thelephora terrestris]